MKPNLLMFGVLLAGGGDAAMAQPFSIGVKGGIPLNDGTVGGKDESRPYVIGPSAEVRLPAGFAIEVDALYRRLSLTHPIVLTMYACVVASVFLGVLKPG